MLFFRDDLLDAQLLRALAYARDGGAEIGECLAAAATIDPKRPESWRTVWTQLGEGARATAEQCERNGHRTSARDAYLRASNYFRTAGLMHLAPQLRAAAQACQRRQRECFAKAGAQMARAPQVLHIPFEGVTLRGYFFAADEQRRPLVISVGGYDSTAEESYFFNAVPALERGYHCLSFDGPGQGYALFEDGLTFRPDWERVMSAVIDVAVARADVDPDSICVIGESFGGYLVPRAAAHDARIAACVLNPAQLDLWQAALARVPLPASIKAELPHGPQWAVTMLRALLGVMATRGSSGWALRRGMLTHGKPTPWEYFVDTMRYRQREIVAQIRCPTLVCDAELDHIAAQARTFFDALTCDKTYLQFRADEGAGDHCVMGNRTLYHQRIFDWLDVKLREPSRGPAVLASTARAAARI